MTHLGVDDEDPLCIHAGLLISFRDCKACFSQRRQTVNGNAKGQTVCRLSLT